MSRNVDFLDEFRVAKVPKRDDVIIGGSDKLTAVRSRDHSDEVIAFTLFFEDVDQFFFIKAPDNNIPRGDSYDVFGIRSNPFIL